MKKQITEQDFLTLSRPAIDAYRDRWLKLSKVPPDKIYFVDIGDMIEFLDGRFINFWRGDRRDWLIVIDDDTHIVREELCDALWEACKDVLEKRKGVEV